MKFVQQRRSGKIVSFLDYEVHKAGRTELCYIDGGKSGIYLMERVGDSPEEAVRLHEACKAKCKFDLV